MGMTAKAKAAFEVYRDLGPTRTVKEAANLLGKSKGNLDRWCGQYGWVALCQEYDNRALKSRLGQRETIRETALQSIIDRMHVAIDKVFAVLTDDRKLPILDRQGEHMIGPDGEPLYKPIVKASTQLQAAQMVLGIGGLVAVKRTETIDRTGEDIDRAAGVMATMTPAQLRRLVTDLKSAETDGTSN